MLQIVDTLFSRPFSQNEPSHNADSVRLSTYDYHPIELAVNKSLYATVDNADKGSDHKREPAKALPVPDVDETKHTCDICMDDLPAAAMHSVGTCMHQFCKGCLERHIQTHMRSRPLPVVCPAVKCRSGIDADECSVLLHNKEDIALLTQVIWLST